MLWAEQPCLCCVGGWGGSFSSEGRCKCRKTVFEGRRREAQPEAGGALTKKNGTKAGVEEKSF